MKQKPHLEIKAEPTLFVHLDFRYCHIYLYKKLPIVFPLRKVSSSFTLNWLFIEIDSRTFGRTLGNPISEYFNGRSYMSDEKTLNATRLRMVNTFNKINQTIAFRAFMSALWYSRLPCFDINGITSSEMGEKSLLKTCLWKNKPILCSAIFKKVATDKGICCAFNKPAADKMFSNSKYRDVISELELQEQTLAFGNLSSSAWYGLKQEPRTQAGTNMGLTVMLDAHTNLVII